MSTIISKEVIEKVKDLIPVPPISKFLIEEFMIHMNIDAHTLSERSNIPFDEMQAILNDELDITPEISHRLASCFGVSDTLFYDIQNDIHARNMEGALQLA